MKEVEKLFQEWLDSKNLKRIGYRYYDVVNWDGAEPEERFYNELKLKEAFIAGYNGGKMKEVDCCYNCISFKQVEFNLMWYCKETGNQTNPNNICEKHSLERRCAKCNNILGNGDCTGNSK